jgi:hypothetical protein
VCGIGYEDMYNKSTIKIWSSKFVTEDILKRCLRCAASCGFGCACNKHVWLLPVLCLSMSCFSFRSSSNDVIDMIPQF